MMKFKLWSILCLIPVILMADSERVRPFDWAQPVTGIELNNFYQMSEQVYRSQQPDDEEMKQLESMGIRSILNLRKYHSDDDKAEGTSLKLFHVPIDAGDVDDESILKSLRVINSAEKPILIHCWHGSDRTGVVSAMYRMVFQDWPRERAIDEFINGGFGYHARFYPNIERYLQTVDIASIRQKVLSQ
jgi:tyrosine-protein phosphatase SIW14